jgi:dCMP deaminase
METPSWDDYFMTMVYLVASRSKDKNTHIGAVVVGSKNEVRSIGYNGFVRGLKDNAPERQERPEKYFWFEHSERNSIYNATLMGVSLEGCRMYTNGIPCMDCARGIVQSGIKEVIVDPEWDKDSYSEKWVENNKRTIEMFKEVGIKLRHYEGKLMGKISKFRNGVEILLD